MVGDIDRRMSEREFTEWMAYDRLNPLGTVERLEGMLAKVCAHVYNPWRGKGRAREPVHFLPVWSRPTQTPEDQEVMMQVWGRLHNKAWERRQAAEKRQAEREKAKEKGRDG